MTGMQGNPYALTPDQIPPQLEHIDAVMALAFEVRTANLLAFSAMIPQEAIGKAREALRFRVPPDDVEAALEAAAPYLRAQALEDAADEAQAGANAQCDPYTANYGAWLRASNAASWLHARAVTERGEG